MSRELHRAAFAYSLIAALKARKVIPERPEFSGCAVDGGINHAAIEEWHAGEPAEVVARKVITTTSAAYWLRADLADAAALRIAEAEAEIERAKADVVGWSAARDQEAADAAGLTLMEYRLKRNHAGMERDRRAGKYAWMGR